MIRYVPTEVVLEISKHVEVHDVMKFARAIAPLYPDTYKAIINKYGSIARKHPLGRNKDNVICFVRDTDTITYVLLENQDIPMIKTSPFTNVRIIKDVDEYVVCLCAMMEHARLCIKRFIRDTEYTNARHEYHIGFLTSFLGE